MKKVMKVVVVLVFILLIMLIVVMARDAAAETVWTNIAEEVSCREFNCAALDADIIYVGTTNGAYRTEDGGASWERIFTGIGAKDNVRQIRIKSGIVYICTDKGLHMSYDRGKTWKSSTGIASKAQIFSITISSNAMPNMVIATNEGVYESLAGAGNWHRLLYPNNDTNNNTYIEGDAENEAILPQVRAVEFSSKKPECLYIGTEDGAYISEDFGKTLKRLTDEGLTKKKITHLSESRHIDKKLYAIADSHIFFFDTSWHSFEKANSLRDIKSLAFNAKNPGPGLIVAKQGVYKSSEYLSEAKIAEMEAINLLNCFYNEPTVNEVQDAAIRYAEVHPDKILTWRRRASVSAILPRLSFGIDESETNTYEIYTSSTKQYTVEGPPRNSDGWDVTFTWDLGDLIWNSDQTSIDSRSKLMVQLRDDILDEVTSYYFERRKLQIELLEFAPNSKNMRIKKELRIMELTANLDALTGRYFSRKLENHL